MKRKREQKLNPCEEKALVHLQALQIKEKEARSRKRAKKKKEVSSISVTGQNIPYQQQPIPTRDVSPFVFEPSTQTPTRNEWDQLIPATLQTAQFMILNHAMSRQGQWNQASQPQQVRAPIIPAVVGAPSEIEMADLSRPNRRLIGQRRGPVRAGLDVPSGVVSAVGRGLRGVGRGVARGTLAIGRGVAKGTLAVGRGAIKGLSAIGSGAGRLATSIGGTMDRLEAARQLAKANKEAAKERARLQQEQNRIREFESDEQSSKYIGAMEALDYDAERTQNEQILRDLTQPNHLYKDEFIDRFSDTQIFKKDIPYSTTLGPKIDKPILKTSGKTTQVMNAWRQARKAVGSAIDRVTEQLKNRKQLQDMRKQAIKDKAIELESNKDVSQPNKTSSENLGILTQSEAKRVGNLTSDLKTMLDENIPPLEPLNPNQPAIELTYLQTPAKKTLQVTSMGKSPSVKIVTDDFKSKKVTSGTESNTTQYLLTKDQSFRQDVYNKSKNQPSMRTPTLGSDEYAKTDDFWALDKFGNLVSRNDYQTIHPEQVVNLSNFKQSKLLLDGKSGNIKTPRRFVERLTNQKVLNYFQDTENAAAIRDLLQGFDLHLPRITSHHYLNENGGVEPIVKNDSMQSFDPNAENEYFAEFYKQFLQKNANQIEVQQESQNEIEPEQLNFNEEISIPMIELP